MQKRHINGHSNTVTWGGKNICKKIHTYLYKDSKIHLNRKFNKFNKLLAPYSSDTNKESL